MSSRRIATAALIGTLALTACGGPESAPTPAPPPTDPSTAEPEDLLTMRGIDLYLHDDSVTGSEARRPNFWVHAERFTMNEEDIWAFEDARAVVYHEDSEAEDIVFEAERGTFEENTRAYMSGAVKAYMGGMVLELADIEWLNGDADTPSYAHSDSALRVNDPNMQLNASGIRIHPEDRRFEMTDVSGMMRFGSTTDETINETP